MSNQCRLYLKDSTFNSEHHDPIDRHTVDWMTVSNKQLLQTSNAHSWCRCWLIGFVMVRGQPIDECEHDRGGSALLKTSSGDGIWSVKFPVRAPEFRVPSK